MYVIVDYPCVFVAIDSWVFSVGELLSRAGDLLCWIWLWEVSGQSMS